jgi:UDP-3-O-[3-hydroxymyristoyl] glucosamine N-acyltransferase
MTRDTTVRASIIELRSASSIFALEHVSVARAVLQTGQRLHLESLMQREPAQLASGDHIRGAVIIDSTAKIGSNCLIGPDVSIGPDCVVGDGVRLANCVIMQGCQVRPRTRFICMHAQMSEYLLSTCLLIALPHACAGEEVFVC